MPHQATRAYLHKEDDVEAALARAGFKVRSRRRLDRTPGPVYTSCLRACARLLAWQPAVGWAAAKLLAAGCRQLELTAWRAHTTCPASLCRRSLSLVLLLRSPSVR